MNKEFFNEFLQLVRIYQEIGSLEHHYFPEKVDKFEGKIIPFEKILFNSYKYKYTNLICKRKIVIHKAYKQLIIYTSFLTKDQLAIFVHDNTFNLSNEKFYCSYIITVLHWLNKYEYKIAKELIECLNEVLYSVIRMRNQEDEQYDKENDIYFVAQNKVTSPIQYFYDLIVILALKHGYIRINKENKNDIYLKNIGHIFDHINPNKVDKTNTYLTYINLCGKENYKLYIKHLLKIAQTKMNKGYYWKHFLFYCEHYTILNEKELKSAVKIFEQKSCIHKLCHSALEKVNSPYADEYLSNMVIQELGG